MSERESTMRKILESILVLGLCFLLILFAVGSRIESSSEIPPEPSDERLESVDVNVFDADRSSRWIGVRRDHIAKNP